MEHQLDLFPTDGWIESFGQYHPIMNTPDLVEVKFRCGARGIGRGRDYYWQQDGDDADIVAFRLVNKSDVRVQAIAGSWE